VKVLVFTHRLDLGGTQVNAIDLAAGVRDRFGHDVVLFGIPGPAARLATDRGLRVIPAPEAKVRPSMAMMSALRGAVAAEAPDVVHAWDWPQVLDAYFGQRVLGGPPVLGTSMSMSVERFLPRAIPMTFGTAELRARAAAVWSSPVSLLEPPVDTEVNRSGAVDPSEFLQRHGLAPGVPTVVIVSRLTRDMKLDGVRRAIGAVAHLAGERPVRLVIVGDGDAFEELSHDAAAVGRRAVVMTGAMRDPRPAYAAADVVLGMGGSALRAMAFAKPVIILGEGGFAEVLDPKTAGQFLWQGFYGVGDGGPDRLHELLSGLLDDPGRMAELGQFGLELVTERYGLDAATAGLERLYRDVASQGPLPRGTLVAEAARSLAVRSSTNFVPRGLKQRVGALRHAT
jgi:glycosyltransferase involved in cell wall biosynthesis